MPNRIIRESMLDSTRYLSVDESARLLYTHLLLLADDFGCLSVEYPFIGRRCFANRPPDDRLDELIGQLATADLIRLYNFRSLRYAFIPRFRQRLKRETLKNPQPPDELLIDDMDAQEKFKKLNGHSYKGTALGQTEVRPQSAPVPPDGGTRAVDRQVAKAKEGIGSEFGSQEEVKPAPASDSRNAVDLVAQLAEKMRLKESP